MRSGYDNFLGHQSKFYYSLLYSEHCGEKATQRRLDYGSASQKSGVPIRHIAGRGRRKSACLVAPASITGGVAPFRLTAELYTGRKLARDAEGEPCFEAWLEHCGIIRRPNSCTAIKIPAG
jgi:hypothetical protein